MDDATPPDFVRLGAGVAALAVVTLLDLRWLGISNAATVSTLTD